MLNSPLVLDVLMHHHQYQTTYPYTNKLSMEALDYLKRNKMLSWQQDGACYKTTPKAQFFIDHILSTPFPTEKVTYVIERNDAK